MQSVSGHHSGLKHQSGTGGDHIWEAPTGWLMLQSLQVSPSITCVFLGPHSHVAPCAIFRDKQTFLPTQSLQQLRQREPSSNWPDIQDSYLYCDEKCHNPPHPWYTEGRLYYYEFLCLLVDICRPGKWLESYVQQLVCWTIYKWSTNLNKLFLAKQPTPRLKVQLPLEVGSKVSQSSHVKMPSFTGAIYMFIACYKNYFGNLAHEDEDSTV